MIREEIQWIAVKDILFTTLFIWSSQYIPYQCAIFRKDIQSIVCSIRVYFKVNDYIHIKDFVFYINENTSKQEKLFHTTIHIKRILDDNINDWCNSTNDTPESESLGQEIEELLKKVFFDSATMKLFQGTHPDFGFYTLAPNFHRLKKLAKEGMSPTIDEEFERLINKYNK